MDVARGSVALTVNGSDHGAPGKPGDAWQGTFSYGVDDTEAPTSPGS